MTPTRALAAGTLIGVPRRERLREQRRARRRGRFARSIAMALAAACSGGREPSEVEEAVSVIFDRNVYTLAGPGESATVTASAVTASRRPVAGRRIAWRSSNPAVATVTPEGVVTAQGDGVARIWAVAGRDSAFAVVVVERPPARFTLLPAALHFDAVGATATLAVQTGGDSTMAIAAACQSADTGVAVVDTAGTIVSRGNGRTRVRCRVGEVEDSVGVEVKQQVTRVAVVRQGAISLRMERDTFALQLARVDRLGAPVEGTPVTWASLTPGVVRVDPARGVAVGVAVGQGKVAGLAAGIGDTVVVEVRDSNDVLTAPIVAARPRLPLDRRARAVRLAQQQRRLQEGVPVLVRSPAETDSIIRTQVLQGGSSRITEDAWRKFTLSATVMSAEHRVNEGFGLEQTSGIMFGGEVDYLASRRLRFRVVGMTGKLNADTGTVEDRQTSDGLFDVGVAALPWLSFRVGGGRRVYISKAGDTRISTQGWWTLRTGGEARFALADGAVHTILHFTLLPVVSVTPATVAPPSLGTIAGAAVEYRTGALSAGVDYSLERYSFPATSGVQRREQFATLRLRLGLQFGGVGSRE